MFDSLKGYSLLLMPQRKENDSGRLTARVQNLEAIKKLVAAEIYFLEKTLSYASTAFAAQETTLIDL